MVSKKGYFFLRIKRLFYLYAFWVGLFLIARYHCDPDFLPNLFSQGIGHILSFFAGEGISLYYFNFSLLVITIFAFPIMKLHRNILWALLGLTIVFIILFY
jgi:hypothetical protein